jgi:sugar-specific transcriptional regulator TrmB
MQAAELRGIGFSEKKGALYLALLEAGRGTAAGLAQAARVRRTTAYDLLDELIGENLASVSFEGKRRVFVAESPEHLQAQADRWRRAMEQVMPALNQLYCRPGARPRVRYYEGRSGIELVHEDLLKVKSREYFYFGSMRGFVDLLGEEYMESFIRRRIRKRIWSNALRVRSQEIDHPLAEPGPANYRRVRYLRQSPVGDVANLVLFDGKVAICSSIRESYGLVIESRDMHAILKLVWDCLWSVAEE